MLDLWRLRILREVAIRETMSAAAASLRLSTSAVSQHLARLEREAGNTLLHRRGRNIELTHAGRVLAAHAAKILADLDKAESELAALRHEPAGLVRVAAFPSAGLALLPDSLRQLRAKYPPLDITVRDSEPRETVAALRGGQVDIGIIDDLETLAQLDDPGIRTVRLGRDELIVALPTAHPMAAAESVRLADLATDRWLLDDEATPFHDLVIRAAQAEGFTPRVRANCRDGQLMVALVEAGCGISIIPGLWLSQIRSDNVVVRPLRPRIQRTISLAHRRGFEQHPATAAVINQLQMTAGAAMPPADRSA